MSFNDKKERIEYWDSLRGIACLLVFFNHYASIFFPLLINVTDKSPLFYKIWEGTPLNVLTNGNLAVQFFYCLSAYLVAKKVISHKKNALYPLVFLKRLKKMVMLTAPAIVISFILARFGLYNYEYGNTGLGITSTFDFDYSFTSLVKDLIFVIVAGQSKYSFPLGNITLIILGGILVSYFVYGIEEIANDVPIEKGVLWLGAILLLFISHSNHNLASFVFGAGVAMIEKSAILEKCFEKNFFRFLFIILACYFAFVGWKMQGIWFPISFASNYVVIIRSFGVSMILLSTIKSEIIRKIGNRKWLVHIGRISMYVYAIHIPILFAVAIRIYLKAPFGNTVRHVTAFFVSLVITLIISDIWNRIIAK